MTVAGAGHVNVSLKSAIIKHKQDDQVLLAFLAACRRLTCACSWVYVLFEGLALRSRLGHTAKLRITMKRAVQEPLHSIEAAECEELLCMVWLHAQPKFAFCPRGPPPELDFLATARRWSEWLECKQGCRHLLPPLRACGQAHGIIVSCDDCSSKFRDATSGYAN